MRPARRGPLRPGVRGLRKGLAARKAVHGPQAGEPAARRGASGWVRLLAPLLVLVGYTVVELVNYVPYPGLTLLTPALAALLVGPAATAAYTVAAVSTAFLLAMYDGFPGGPGNAATSTGIASGVAIAGGIAVVASLHRVQRETKLENITRVAEVAQHTILGPVPPSLDGLSLAVSYQSATADAEVGGDLYEVTRSPWGTRILIGDVRGKGLDAVRIASRVLGCFRVVAELEREPARVMAALEWTVAAAGGPEDFVTATFVQIEQGRLVLVNAGHPDPVLVHDGTANLVPVQPRQPPLGLGAAGTAGAAGTLVQAIACCSTPTVSPRPATRRPVSSSRSCPPPGPRSSTAPSKAASPSLSNGCAPGPCRPCTMTSRSSPSRWARRRPRSPAPPWCDRRQARAAPGAR
jgi:phosphoserine phosphatase RsbU/P